MMGKCLVENKRGISELPMQYMIAVIIAAIAILLMGIYAQNLWREQEMNKAIEEVRKIVNQAEKIYSVGDEGTKMEMDINLPNSVKKVVFGSANEKLANRYYILMEWGKNKSFFAEEVNFKGKNGKEAILYGGKERVVLELIDKGGKKYVKIYSSE